MGLFRVLCKEREPTVFEMYVGAPRGRRNEMMKAALKRYESGLLSEEIKQIGTAMKALDKLASTRNELAHGHCSDYSASMNNQTVMSGHFLLPSLNEGVFHERSLRFAHTVESMSEFTAAVRHHRGTVMDIQFAIMQRQQDAEKRIEPEVKIIMSLAKAVADGAIPPERVLENIRRA